MQFEFKILLISLVNLRSSSIQRNCLVFMSWTKIIIILRSNIFWANLIIEKWNEHSLSDTQKQKYCAPDTKLHQNKFTLFTTCSIILLQLDYEWERDQVVHVTVAALFWIQFSSLSICRRANEADYNDHKTCSEPHSLVTVIAEQRDWDYDFYV